MVTWMSVWQSQQLTQGTTSAGDQFTSRLLYQQILVVYFYTCHLQPFPKAYNMFFLYVSCIIKRAFGAVCLAVIRSNV